MFGVPLRHLGLFAGVYVAAMIAVLALDFLLKARFGLDGSSATAIVPFVTACLIAGRKYAQESGWTWSREDRRNLAIAYSAVSFLLALALSAVFLVTTPDLFVGGMSFWAIFFMVFALLFGALITYAIGRFLLGWAIRQKALPEQ